MHYYLVKPPRTATAQPPVVELMFADAVSRAKELAQILHKALPMCKLSKNVVSVSEITKTQWEAFDSLVLMGVTPAVAAQQTFFMTAQEFKKALTEGRVSEPGTVLGQFARGVDATRCRARSIAEARVFYEAPLPWLMGPGGRGDDHEPSWGQVTMRHVGADGEHNPELNVNVTFTSQGPQVRKEVTGGEPGN